MLHTVEQGGKDSRVEEGGKDSRVVMGWVVWGLFLELSILGKDKSPGNPFFIHKKKKALNTKGKSLLHWRLMLFLMI